MAMPRFQYRIRDAKETATDFLQELSAVKDNLKDYLRKLTREVRWGDQSLSYLCRLRDNARRLLDDADEVLRRVPAVRREVAYCFDELEARSENDPELWTLNEIIEVLDGRESRTEEIVVDVHAGADQLASYIELRMARGERG